VLVVERRIKIRLADALWCHCYYRPADLRAFADGLARSPHPRLGPPRPGCAGSLRRFAADPKGQPRPPRRS
jgi:hypothetical protein